MITAAHFIIIYCTRSQEIIRRVIKNVIGPDQVPDSPPPVEIFP